MALAGTAVGDGTVDGHEFPLIAIGQKRELQHTVLSRNLLFAVWFPRDESVIRVDPARSDAELTDATSRVGAAIAGLRSEPFVKMIMAVQHDVGVGVVEDVEKWPHGRVVAILAGGEQRMVPVGERT